MIALIVLMYCAVVRADGGLNISKIIAAYSAYLNGAFKEGEWMLSISMNGIDHGAFLAEKNQRENTARQRLNDVGIVDLDKRLERGRRSAVMPASVPKLEKVGVYRWHRIRRTTLSSSYPELIWPDPGPEYLFRIQIENKVHEVSGEVAGKMIRWTVPQLTPGTHEMFMSAYRISDAVELFQAKHSAQLIWLDQAQTARIDQRVTTLLDETGDDPWILANYLDSEGVLVPAFDYYEQAWKRDPVNGMIAQLLLKVTKQLGLQRHFQFYWFVNTIVG
ncbi:MAG: hypothetical protein HQL54_12475 [Magnetococcales bacterium]|nr:hypothetical protein [Magnetococcales bacterium]